MQFWSHHFSTLITSDFPSENLIFAGDFNTVLNSSLDRENPSHPIFQSESSLLSNIFSTLSLDDSFRLLHPLSKEFTFINRSTKFGSRIDHIYTSSSLNCFLNSSGHLSLPHCLSDHSQAVTLSLSIPFHFLPGPGIWRLNSAHINKPGFKSIVIDVVTKHHASSWDSLVSQLSWKLKKYSKGEALRIKNTVLHLQTSVDYFSNLLTSHPLSSQYQHGLLKAKASLHNYLYDQNLALQVKAGVANLSTRDIASSSLAALIKQRKRATVIPSLKAPSQDIVSSPQGILHIATNFYKSLYSLPSEVNPSRFPWSILPQAPTVDMSSLLKPFTEQELDIALNSLALHKAPGTSGLNTEFFKANKALLLPLLTTIANGFFEGFPLPSSFCQAVTILLF
jgi:hypothetical protein